MKLKKLPIGISTFKTIIDGDYVYVDKTGVALKMIETGGGYYFLSRPRRFGKSLFLDTLRTIFNGERQLFKGLYIYDRYDFIKYPVIQINFSSGRFRTSEDFDQRVYEILKINQNNLQVFCDSDMSGIGCFEELIHRVHKEYKQKVVILIDEYDKPILDNIENAEIATLMREELKNFYSVIKSSDEFLKFVFITGVSKFSKVSLFSGLNNLEDITLNANYATICGYTQNDLETVFKDHLAGVDWDKVRHWYNGYKFLGEGVYNPFDILLFISNNKVFENYWFGTATPSFFLKLIEKNNYFLPNLENIVKDSRMLNSFDVDYIELETLMWQTGYLTIVDSYESIKGQKYRLCIPNNEVKVSIMSYIVDFLTKNTDSEIEQEGVYESLVNADFNRLETVFKSLFASIPYNNFSGKKLYEYEGYFVSVFYAYIKALGIDISCEDTTNRGRIDITIKLPGSIIIIEFKVDGKDALKQIQDKKYHQKYMDSKKDIYLIGIEFSKEERNISKLEWIQV